MLPSRHTYPVSREVMAETTIASMAKILAHLDGETWNAQWLGAMAVTAFDDATLRSYVDPSDPLILDRLERSGCAAAAAYLAAVIPGSEPIEAPGPQRRRVTVERAKLDRRKLEPAVQWRYGMLAAAAARDHAAIDALASIRVDDLLTLGRTPPSWFATEAAALIALFRREPHAGELLAAAAREADPDKVPVETRNWVLDIVFPEIELAFRVTEGDHAAFEEALARSIELHHHYYATDGKNITLGQLAIGPLAIACLARDLGMKTTIESDYLPRWIIDRP